MDRVSNRWHLAVTVCDHLLSSKEPKGMTFFLRPAPSRSLQFDGSVVPSWGTVLACQYVRHRVQ